jgi:O-antigen/teichoic acid export membrane protein
MKDSPQRRTAAALHEALVGSGIGERTQTFFRGLAWNAPAAIVSRVLAGVTTLLSARFLGPEQFGSASLALAATLWIQIPLFLGMQTAIVHYAPRADPRERESWLRTGLVLLLCSGSATLGGGLALSGPCSRLLGIGIAEFRLALLWCTGFLLYAVAGSLLAAREAFRRRAAMELVFAALFPAFVVGFWSAGLLDPARYLGALATAFAIAGAIGLLTGLPVHAPTRAAGKARMLLGYGLIATGGSVAFALLQSLGRLIANRFLGLAEVGLLAAYQAGSVQIALYFLTFVGSAVLLPIASRTPDRAALLRKITWILPILVVALTAFHSALLGAFFCVLGAKYTPTLAAALAFAAASGLVTAHGLLGWFFASGGRRGVTVASLSGLAGGLVHAVACALLIRRWGVSGAGIALVLGYMTAIAVCYVPALRRWGTAP